MLVVRLYLHKRPRFWEFWKKPTVEPIDYPINLISEGEMTALNKEGFFAGVPCRYCIHADGSRSFWPELDSSYEIVEIPT